MSASPNSQDRSLAVARRRALFIPGGAYFYARRPFLGLAAAISECGIVLLFLISLSETLAATASAVPFFLASGLFLAVSKSIGVYHAEYLLAASPTELESSPASSLSRRRIVVWVGAASVLLGALTLGWLLGDVDALLMRAARDGDSSAIQGALERGARVNARDETGVTPLLLAAENGHAVAVTDLVDAGADLNGADDLGVTPLMAAALRGHSDVVRALADAGADIEARGDDGVTFLMEAASVGRLDIVRWLIQMGAEVDARDVDGWTPLMWAAVSGHAEVVQALLGAGANPTARNNESATALDVAERAGQNDIVGILEDLAVQDR